MSLYKKIYHPNVYRLMEYGTIEKKSPSDGIKKVQYDIIDRD